MFPTVPVLNTFETKDLQERFRNIFVDFRESINDIWGFSSFTHGSEHATIN